MTTITGNALRNKLVGTNAANTIKGLVRMTLSWAANNLVVIAHNLHHPRKPENQGQYPDFPSSYPFFGRPHG